MAGVASSPARPHLEFAVRRSESELRAELDELAARSPAIQNWDERYRLDRVEQMPWFYPELDPDLARALARLELLRGRALDVGTGPGTQAIELASRGFEVSRTFAGGN